MTLLQAGLYNKWMDDLLDDVRRYGRKKRLEEVVEMGVVDDTAISNEDEGAGGWTKPLTLVHLQGPLFLLLLGLGKSLYIFCVEYISQRFR